ncbi:hypothetical protein SNE40_021649 [Patella caerulea]|uniref:Uncharacterized protein n=1 Tax=Patella caerulea TaxID=87958 RepID=A0AAN8GGU3_PATCE
MEPLPTTTNAATLNQTTTEDIYDNEGAMKYIVITVLVYSLMGTVTMLLMRIRRRAMRSVSKIQGNGDQSVQDYLKGQPALEIESFRYRLRCEQKKRLGSICSYPKPNMQESCDKDTEIAPLNDQDNLDSHVKQTALTTNSSSVPLGGRYAVDSTNDNESLSLSNDNVFECSSDIGPSIKMYEDRQKTLARIRSSCDDHELYKNHDSQLNLIPTHLDLLTNTNNMLSGTEDTLESANNDSVIIEMKVESSEDTDDTIAEVDYRAQGRDRHSIIKLI